MSYPSLQGPDLAEHQPDGWTLRMAAVAEGAMMATGEAGTFGALLRRYRQAAALSQEALAERAGLWAVAISALERGARRAPHLATVEVLATALALDAAERAALVAAARLERADPFAADVLLPLVGRARELAALDHFLAVARAARGGAGAAAGGGAGHGQNAAAVGRRPAGRPARLVRAGGRVLAPWRAGTLCAAA